MFLIALTMLLSCNNSSDKLNTEPKPRNQDESISQNQDLQKSDTNNSGQKDFKQENNTALNIHKRSVLEAKVVVLDEPGSDQYTAENDPFKKEQEKYQFNTILSDIIYYNKRNFINFRYRTSGNDISNVIRLEDNSGLYKFSKPTLLYLEDEADGLDEKDNFIIFNMELLNPNTKITQEEINEQIKSLLNKIIDNTKNNKTVAITFNDNQISDPSDDNANKKLEIEQMKRFLKFFNSEILKTKDLNLKITFIFSDMLSNKSEIENMFKDVNITYSF